MRQTTNLGLFVWDSNSDIFDPSQLASNWDLIDANANASRPTNEVVGVSSLPVTGLFDGLLVYLLADNGGFKQGSILRYQSGSWAPIGPFETFSSIPISGNFAGRIVLLTAASGGFAQWTLIRYDGAAWDVLYKQIDVLSAVPSTGNYAGRIIVLSAADSGFKAWDTLVYAGTAYQKIGGISRVTSLDSLTPTDVQEVNLTVDSVNGVNWKFCYNASSASTYKWEFMGGPPLHAIVAGIESTTSTSFTDLTTVGPSITIPRSGDYDIEFSAAMSGSVSDSRGIIAPKFGSASTSNGDQTQSLVSTPSTANADDAVLYRRIRRTGLTAGTVVKLQYSADQRGGGGTIWFQTRTLRIWPVRVT